MTTEKSETSSPREHRPCPTRRDGAQVLIEQLVTRATCATRQREHYHKCWTCVFRGAGDAGVGERVAALTAELRRA